MNSYAKCLLPPDTHFNEPCRVLKSLLQKHTFVKCLYSRMLGAYTYSRQIPLWKGQLLFTNSFVCLYSLFYHILYMCIILIHILNSKY